MPNPICVEMNSILQDNVSLTQFTFNPSSYISELYIPNGQSINTVYPTDIQFGFAGTHNRTKDLQFAIRSNNTLGLQGLSGGDFKYATLDGISDIQMDFNFILSSKC